MHMHKYCTKRNTSLSSTLNTYIQHSHILACIAFVDCRGIFITPLLQVVAYVVTSSLPLSSLAPDPCAPPSSLTPHPCAPPSSSLAPCPPLLSVLVECCLCKLTRPKDMSMRTIPRVRRKERTKDLCEEDVKELGKRWAIETLLLLKSNKEKKLTCAICRSFTLIMI